MTVGLVVVSHSAQLAAGVVELAQQMTQGKTPLAAAGGGPDNILGTSADKILEALQQVDNPDGILLLLDLGSAILSAEMALELRDPEQTAPVALSYAPLVEGCVAAALEAALGHSLAQVKQAAEQTASAQQLKLLKPLSELELEEAEPATPAAEVARAHETTPAGVEAQLPLRNPAGLHARPASLFVQTAARFSAQISVRVAARNREANAASIFEILSLGARQGEVITLHASGPQAQEALDALTTLVEANFYEKDETATENRDAGPSSPTSTQMLPQQQAGISTPESWHGVTTSPGVALGPAFLYTGSQISLQAVHPETIAENQIPIEQERLRTALQAAIQELHTLKSEVLHNVGQEEGGIFEAQALMLQDPGLNNAAQTLIAGQQLSAASALAQAGEELAHSLEQLDNALLAARAIDVRDAVGRALRKLGISIEQAHKLTDLKQPVILLAHDLTPSDTAQLRPEHILGICTTRGGPTAHAAIIARALGIPAISGLPETALEAIHNGDELGLDAGQGLLYHRPNAEIHEQLSQRVTQQQQEREGRQQNAQQVHGPLMLQGRHIQLLANIGSEAEAASARQWGAEGIGLLRTEFLFGGASTLPTEEEQYQRYCQIFRAFLGENAPDNKPIVVRTLDAGADKPFPALEAALHLQKEANPALGLRGIRIHLAHEELLVIQLRALLRAGGETGIELHIMFPMITTVEELRSVRAIFNSVYMKLKKAQISIPAQVQVGIMVEVPAAVVMASELAEQADFFSIGANDLLQYTLACDRTNSTIANLYNPLQPAVLRLVQQIAEAGRHKGKPVAVCGEIASDVRIAPILVGMGIDELSMTPTALAAVHKVLSRSSAEAIHELVQKVLQASTVHEVERLCDEFLATHNR